MGDGSKAAGELTALLPTVLDALDQADIGVSITSEGPSGAQNLYQNESFSKIRRRDNEAPAHVEIGTAQTEHDGMTTTVSCIRDVSERTAMARALRASETRFRALAESAPDTITVIVRGTLVYANPAALRALGFDSLEAAATQPLFELLPGYDADLMRERVARLMQGETLAPIEYQRTQDDGTVRFIEISSAVVDWDGEPGVLAVGRDTTERRRMQSELIDADRLATVGTLAAGVAHEINNPLTYVLLHLQRLQRVVPELLADSSQSTAISRMLSESLEGAERVRLIVRDLLAFSYGGDTKDAEVDVNRVLQSALKLASTTIPRHVKVVSNLGELPAIRSNETRLGQVFLNLMVNAGQALALVDEHAASLEISTRHEHEGHILIEIRDTGPGIDEGLRERIFDPFFTTKPRGVGTGLGLSISRTIVEEMDGSLEITNHPDGGARVRVCLPC